MRFRADTRDASAALVSRELDAPDRGAALEALEPDERLRLRQLHPADSGSPAQALDALAELLERGVPLGGAPPRELAAGARAALARGEPLSEALAAEPSAPGLLVEVLAAANPAQPAAFVRLGARWIHRLETTRREQVSGMIYPLVVFCVALVAGGVALGAPQGLSQAVLAPQAQLAGLILALCVLLGGGLWLRYGWGRPGSAASVGFRLQALALFVREGTELGRVWAGLWGGPPPSEGDPCAAITQAAGLGRAESACLAHAMAQGPEVFADELHALGEVRMEWAEARLLREARALRVACYAIGACVAFGSGLQRAWFMREAVS